jgi:hypothetical protein
MKDKDVDTHLIQHLSGESPREAFKQQVLRDSTAEFIRVWQRRSAWRTAVIAAAAILIIGLAFLGGRLSVPRTSAPSKVDAPTVAAESDSVNVPNELVAWLKAASLFRHLGMQDRMARAVERAGRLLPVDTFAVEGQAKRVFAAAWSIENQKEREEPVGISGPNLSAESINKILAQSFGD